MLDALRDQSQYVSIPRRLADVVVEIWTLHFRLVGRKPKSIRQSMENRRFRAAYDFMLLRASMSEVDQDITDWWTKIQEVSEEEQDDMIDTLQAEYQADQEDDGEPNFNSVDYVEKQHSPKKSWNNKGRNGKPRGGRGKNKNRRRAKGDGQTSGNGQQRRKHNPKNRGRNSKGSSQGNSQNNSQNSSQVNSRNGAGENQQQHTRTNTGNSGNGNSGNGNSGNGGSGNGQNRKKPSRSNPYRTRRRSSAKTKKEDSYF